MNFKAVLYVCIAMMGPVCETLAVAANRHAWPDQFELAACGAATVMAALITLKAWSSNPNENKSNTP